LRRTGILPWEMDMIDFLLGFAFVATMISPTIAILLRHRSKVEWTPLQAAGTVRQRETHR
jgi:hypothetical protein